MSAVAIALALMLNRPPGGGGCAVLEPGVLLRIVPAGGAQDEKKPDLKTYQAAGPGHSVESVGTEGRTLTLEDGSVWSVDPRTQYKVASWQDGALITVVLTKEDPDFNYVLNNEDVDDWTFAVLLSEK